MSAVATTRRRRVGRPPNDVPPQPSISARPYPELVKALEEYLAGVRPRSTVSSVIIAALEDYLAERGLLLAPPK